MRTDRSKREARRAVRGRPRRRSGRVLRLRTYLTPSVPRSLFAYLARYLGEQLGMATELQIETRHSGPPRGVRDPFSTNEVDLGFFCAPPYIWLRERPEPPVELVPFGLVFDDPRGGGRPVYFSDIVVTHGPGSTQRLAARTLVNILPPSPGTRPARVSASPRRPRASSSPASA